MNKSIPQQEKQEAYNAWFIAEVDKGLADIEAGDVLTEEEAETHMDKFFANLATESRKAA
jgi:predicted transcriptional regulator